MERLNENILRIQHLIKKINEQSESQNVSIIQGAGGDSYQYKKEGEKYFYAKKSEGTSAKWVEAKGNPSDPKTPAGSIKSKIFKTPTPPGASPQNNTTTQTSSASNASSSSGSSPQNNTTTQTSSASNASSSSGSSPQNNTTTQTSSASNASTPQVQNLLQYPLSNNFSAIADDVYQDLISNKIAGVTIKSSGNQILGSDKETLESIDFVLDINGVPFSATFSRNGLKLINQKTKKQVKPIWTDKKLKYRNFNSTELDPDNAWMKTQIKLSLSEHLRILKKQFKELYLL